MQAIMTTWKGPTNFRGSRIIVSCDAKRIVVPWKSGLGIEENHVAACAALVAQLGWQGKWVAGSLPGKGNEYAHVCVERT